MDLKNSSLLCNLAYVNGQWTAANGGKTFPVTNPATGELLAEELRLAQEALSEITGEFSSDDLLTRIFSSFCIGK